MQTIFTQGRNSVMTLGRAFDLAGSEIERVFIDEVVMSRGDVARLVPASTADEFYDWLRHSSQFVLVAPQVIVGPYRCDFLAGRYSGGRVTLVAVECDGFDFHSRRHQRDRDMRRDRTMRSVRGINDVLRFTGSHIRSNAAGCVDEMLTALGAIGSEDTMDWGRINHG